MIWHSLRWRLQVWHSLILTGLVVGFGVTAYRLARADRLRRIDEELQLRASALASMVRLDVPAIRGGPGFPRPFERDHDHPRFDGPPLGGGPGPGPGPRPDRGPHGEPGRFGAPPDVPNLPDIGSLFDQTPDSFYAVIWQRDGTVQWRSTNAPPEVNRPVRTDLPGLHPAQTRGVFRECLQFTPSGRAVLVGRPITTEQRELSRQAWWLVLAGAGILAAGLTVGWALVSRAIRPIEEIGATAARIAAGDLSQRINAGGTVDELGRLTEVLNSTFARLEAAFAHQARFTADAAHELRTPVTVLLAQAQNGLAAECGNPEHREALEACQRAAQRMRRLIESLLQLARLDAGQDVLTREPFDLAETARDSVDLIEPLARERGLRLHCDLASIECIGDAGSIGQVITNLLANAVRFTGNRGEIHLRTQAHGSLAVLSVTDTGPGIAPAELPHVFERFHRADRSRSRASGGTGLGLAISKAIVEAHGGSIEAANSPSGGAVFTFRLPVPDVSTGLHHLQPGR